MNMAGFRAFVRLSRYFNDFEIQNDHDNALLHYDPDLLCE